MRTRTLAEYLALPWQPFVDTLTQGQDVSVRLTVPGLADFAVYGDSVTEVRDRFREALESHLGGYLAVGKVIPEPLESEVLVGTSGLTGSNAPATTVGKQEFATAA